MAVKLIDVANKAGVSKSTASQYINGRYEYMSADTRERIRVAIEEIGFVPNQLARSLKTKKTNTIGVIVNSISGATTSQVIRGIDDYCKKNNYNVLIYNTDYIAHIEEKSIATLNSLKADGLIITSSGEINTLLNESDVTDLPVVHIHRTFEGLNVNTVLSDFSQGAYEATEHLLSLGHRRIAIITRPYENIATRYSRIKGCIDAFKDSDLTYDTDLIKVCIDDSELPGIYQDLMALKEPPTAIFSMFSIISIGLLNYFNHHNIQVPDDISVVAFDELPMAELLKTPLTTVNQSAYELGEQSAKLLIDKIKAPKEAHKDVTLPCNLIIRNSCKKI